MRACVRVCAVIMFRNLVFKMAAIRQVHRLNDAARRGLQRERVFRDRSHPFKMCDDVELFDRYCFRCDDIMDLVDLVGDNVLISTQLLDDNNAPNSCRLMILCVLSVIYLPSAKQQ